MIFPLITSTSNQLIKKTAALNTQKARKETGCFLIEGANLVSALPNDFDIEYYVIREDKLDTFKYLIRENVDIYPVTENVFNKICDTVTPQGIAAVVKIPNPKTAGVNALILDRVSDSSNVGAILRSAAAFGFTDVYCINCADAFAPKAARASMGGIFFTNIISSNLSVVQTLKSNNYILVAADMHGVNINTLSISNSEQKPIALVIGNEAHGVDKAILNRCDIICSIPINNIESLNAAVAAGILMHRLVDTN